MTLANRFAHALAGCDLAATHWMRPRCDALGCDLAASGCFVKPVRTMYQCLRRHLLMGFALTNVQVQTDPGTTSTMPMYEDFTIPVVVQPTLLDICVASSARTCERKMVFPVDLLHTCLQSCFLFVWHRVPEHARERFVLCPVVDHTWSAHCADCYSSLSLC